MTTLGREFVWPDAAGTPTDPGTTYATVGAGDVYEIGSEGDLVLELRCTAGVPRAWGVWVEVSTDRSTTWLPWAERIVQCSAGAADTGGAIVRLPKGVRVRFSVRRWGGTVNSRLVIFATARESIPPPQFHGIPLELANHVQDGIECWGDGAGGHDHPAAGPNYAPAPAAAADQLRIPTGEADTLVIRYTVAALAATTIEFVVQESRDDGTTFRPLQAVNSVVAGVVSQTLAQEQGTGAVGTFITREIAVRPGTLIRVDAQRTGGGANTELLAYAHLYKLGR